MPELPEVETVRRGLAPSMEGTLLTALELRRADLRFPFPDDFATLVGGQKIVSLSRRAKYLLIDLDDDLTVIPPSSAPFGGRGAALQEPVSCPRCASCRATAAS